MQAAVGGKTESADWHPVPRLRPSRAFAAEYCKRARVLISCVRPGCALSSWNFRAPKPQVIGGRALQGVRSAVATQGAEESSAYGAGSAATVVDVRRAELAAVLAPWRDDYCSCRVRPTPC